MPGINQLGGALSVTKLHKVGTAGENANGAVQSRAKNPETVAADAVKGVEASKRAAKASTDEAATEGRRQSRQYADLAKGRRESRQAESEQRLKMQREKAQAQAAEQANARRASKQRLEKALNGNDLFSPRPKAQ